MCAYLSLSVISYYYMYLCHAMYQTANSCKNLDIESMNRHLPSGLISMLSGRPSGPLYFFFHTTCDISPIPTYTKNTEFYKDGKKAKHLYTVPRYP